METGSEEYNIPCKDAELSNVARPGLRSSRKTNDADLQISSKQRCEVTSEQVTVPSLLSGRHRVAL